MRRRTATTAIAHLAAALLIGCVPTDDGGTTTVVPADSIHVAPNGTGDGSSATRPTTLTKALEAANGRPIVLAGGTYDAGAGILVQKDATILGSGADKTTITCAAAEACLTVENAKVRVEKIALKDGKGHGVVARSGADVTVSDASISGMKKDGVHAETAKMITLFSSKIIGSAGRGLYAKGTGKIAVIDPVYAPTPRNDGGKVGVIDPVYAPKSEISGNGQGGIAVIDPVYSPKADVAEIAILVQSTLIKGNGRYGLGIWGGSAKVLKSAIVGSKVDDAAGPWADGILVAAGSENANKAILVQLDIDAQSVVLDNARTGVLVSTKAQVAISADVSNNGLGGTWAMADGTRLSIDEKAAYSSNAMVGVVVSKGADLLMKGTSVKDTKLHTTSTGAKVGDGVGIYDGARATIEDANLVDNARAAIVVHAAKKNASGEADVVVKGCKMTGGQHTFVINGAPVPAAAASKRNSADGNQSGSSGKTDGYSSNANLPVQTGYCDGYGESKCTPDA